MSATTDARVAIYMGSDSDLPVMAEAARILKRLGVPFELEVSSAHRTPDRTVDLVRTAPERGVRVFILGAGVAAHLAGVVAAHTTLPVLGVPLAGGDLNGLDALLSTVQMPAGIPVGTLAIGKAGAANAAWLAASILALQDPDLAGRLADERAAMGDKVRKKSEAAQGKLADLLAD
jgi:phosphoribosylaminoimidazole carboxylase PurE protein